jgi:hypothetical protein
MEAVQLVTGLDEKMRLWREGCLSDSEIMAWLITAMSEVQMSIQVGEEIKAEQRMKRIGMPPFSTKSQSSVECPHCHWGIDPSAIEQHIREKH